MKGFGHSERASQVVLWQYRGDRADILMGFVAFPIEKQEFMIRASV